MPSQAVLNAKKREQEERVKLLAAQKGAPIPVQSTSAKKPVAARKSFKPNIPTIDLVIWPAALILWFLTSESWPWILAVLIRIGWVVAGYLKVHPIGRANLPVKPFKLQIPTIDYIVWPVTLILWFLTSAGWPWVVAIVFRLGYEVVRYIKNHFFTSGASGAKARKMPQIPHLDKVQLRWIDLIWIGALLYWFMTAETWPWFAALAVRTGWWWFKDQGQTKSEGWIVKNIPTGVRKNVATSVGGGGCLLFGVKLFAMFIGVFVVYQFLGLFGLGIGVIASMIWLRQPTGPTYAPDGTMSLPKPWLRSLVGMPGIWLQHNSISKDGVRFGLHFAGFDKRTNLNPKQIVSINVDDTLVDWILGAAVVTVVATGGKGNAEIRVCRWAPPEEMENQLKKAYSVVTPPAKTES